MIDLLVCFVFSSNTFRLGCIYVKQTSVTPEIFAILYSLSVNEAGVGHNNCLSSASVGHYYLIGLAVILPAGYIHKCLLFVAY